MKGRVKDQGIILKINPYGDSSLIAQVLCRQLGNISFIAKGLRKKTSYLPLQPLGEYELTIYEPLESGLYLFNEASVAKERDYDKPKNWSTALCGAELIAHLVVAADEHRLYFDLLSEYLNYLIPLEYEPLPIFWRLFLRIMQLQGLKLDPERCSACGRHAKPQSYLRLDSSLLCRSCSLEQHSEAELQYFSLGASELLALLPQIGNYIKDLKLDRSVVRELNEFFIYYYQAHTHQTLKLKSLSVLEQLY